MRGKDGEKGKIDGKEEVMESYMAEREEEELMGRKKGVIAGDTQRRGEGRNDGKE